MKCWTLVAIFALSGLLPISAQNAGNDIDMPGSECQNESGHCVDEYDTQNCMVPLGKLDCPKGNHCCQTFRKGYDAAGLLLKQAINCNQDSRCMQIGGKCISSKDECETKKINNLCGQKKCACCLDSLTDKIGNLESLIESMDTKLENKLSEISEDINDVNNMTSETQDMVRELLDGKESECESKGNVSNCKELLEQGATQSGVYTITPEGFSDGVEVYCDQETDGGGWTVIVQRKQQTDQLDFAKSFEEYAAGFGDPNGEIWIGNRILHSMTGDEPFTLRIEAKSQDGESRTGIWETFSVGSEVTEFTLSVGDYSGSSTLGDGLSHSHSGASANNMKFSTYDRDNDGHANFDCSGTDGRGGWWYNSCYGANPTAPFADDSEDVFLGFRANWRFWEPTSTGSYVALSEIKFKIRP